MFRQEKVLHKTHTKKRGAKDDEVKTEHYKLSVVYRSRQIGETNTHRYIKASYQSAQLIISISKVTTSFT